MNKYLTLAIASLFLFTLMVGCLNLENGNGSGLDHNDTDDELNKTNQTEVIEDVLIVVGPCNSTILLDVDVCLLEHEMCSQIKTPELRDQCFYTQLNCEMINDEDKRKDCTLISIERECQQSPFPSLCKVLLTDNVEYCGKNEECLTYYAKEVRDESLCEKIETGYKKSACIAIVNQAWNMCYQLEKYEATQSECLKIYSEVTGTGNTLCEGLEESRYYYDCISVVALNTNNEKLCSKILIYNLRRDCYYNLAMEHDRAEVCDLSPDQDDASYCRTRLANKLYKPVLCEPINNPKFKWGCFGDSIVKGKTKLSECNKINGNLYPEWKELCINIAVED